MSDKGAQSEDVEEDKSPRVLGGSENLSRVEDDIAKMLAHCPTDPVERLFWHEHWLRVASKRLAASDCQETRCLLRQMAIRYAAVAASLGTPP